MHCENADAPDDWIAVTPSDTAPVELVGLWGSLSLGSGILFLLCI